MDIDPPLDLNLGAKSMRAHASHAGRSLDMNLGSKAYHRHMARDLLDIDRQFDPVCFRALERMIGKSFTLDCAADDFGKNALCQRFCSPSRSFLTARVRSQDVLWVHAPFDRISEWVNRYEALRASDPSLSACFLVPARFTAAWMQKLQRMGARVVHEYTRGSPILAVPEGKGDELSAQCRYTMQALYVPCRSPSSSVCYSTSTDGEPSLTFRGKVAGAEASILFDTGATHNFIDTTKCRALGLPIQSTHHDTVRVGDGNLVTLRGQCTLNVTVQGFKCSVTALVFDGLTSTCDLVLGDPFMKQFDAVLKPADMLKHAETFWTHALADSSAAVAGLAWTSE
jgi:hypothetical protein